MPKSFCRVYSRAKEPATGLLLMPSLSAAILHTWLQCQLQPIYQKHSGRMLPLISHINLTKLAADSARNMHAVAQPPAYRGLHAASNHVHDHRHDPLNGETNNHHAVANTPELMRHQPSHIMPAEEHSDDDSDFDVTARMTKTPSNVHNHNHSRSVWDENDNAGNGHNHNHNHNGSNRDQSSDAGNGHNHNHNNNGSDRDESDAASNSRNDRQRNGGNANNDTRHALGRSASFPGFGHNRRLHKVWCLSSMRMPPLNPLNL